MAENQKYNFKDIETKWQKYWEDSNTFVVADDGKKKFYGLVEFPYPSGDGLHTGHLRSYTALDVVSRKKRMDGYSVLYPMGFDAFGLPAENYAIKTNTAPQITTERNIANYTKQMKSIGLSFDWDRSFSTTSPDYYRWTQWIFIQMYKQGLAYKSKENINWCTSCKIGLANEEVVAGVCERCGAEVVKKEKEQWLLRITKYADRLIEDLDQVDFLESIKKQQKDWIGRSEGAEVNFKIKDTKEELKVFTTRPDTLFGATFMVVAPEHAVLHSLENKISNLAEVKTYIKAAQKKTDQERGADDKEKTGVELKGLKAINPVNNEEIPIFVADYIMMGYGTGAIMAVPGHDQRDYDFARKYNLNIRDVVMPVDGEIKQDEEYRETISATIQRKSDGKFLLLKWKKFDWLAPVIGGIEVGETPEQAAEREVLEETGYKAKAIRRLGGQTEEHFYADNKKVWRYRVDNPILLELEDEVAQSISTAEKAKHEIIWLSEKDALQSVSHKYNKIGILIYLDKYGAYSGEGRAINSGKFNGLLTAEFNKKIIKWLEKNKLGKAIVNYKLHDWIFSRQRYWGEPIPMINCAKCAWVPVAEDELPVKLPEIDDFKPTDDGGSPLAKVIDWVNTTCPECGGIAQRETDVMPNWAGSNWYFIRYCDPKNNKQLVDPKKAEHWLPVDWYNGGMEHTTLHLLYSRFVFKFLYDIGAIPKKVGSEPYKKRTAQGMILGGGGVKMSKSKGNVINPDDYVAKYGADTVRVYEMFMGPFDQSIAWDDKGVVGVHRFLEKVWSLRSKISTSKTSKEIETILHKTIKKVDQDIESMRFNTAISQLMILANDLDKQKEINKNILDDFVLLLAPFAPHMAEELWQVSGNKDSLAQAKWPSYDANLAKDEMIRIGIQINGKVRDEIELVNDTEPNDEVKSQVLAQPKVKKYIEDKKLVKFIHVKNKIISLVVK